MFSRFKKKDSVEHHAEQGGVTKIAAKVFDQDTQETGNNPLVKRTLLFPTLIRYDSR